MPVTINGSTGLTSNNGSVFTDSSGNAGIGTSTPTERLQIVGTGDLKAEILTNSTNNVAFRWKNGSNSYIWQVIGGAFRVYDETSAADRLRIDSSGRVTTPSQPAFYAHGFSTNTTLNSNSSDIQVPVNATVSTNIGNNYNSSNSRFTAPIAGFYFFYGQFMLNSWPSDYGYIFIRLLKNGSSSDSEIMIPRPSGGQFASVVVATSFSLAANDYIELFARQSGGSSNATIRDGFRVFCGYLVG